MVFTLLHLTLSLGALSLRLTESEAEADWSSAGLVMGPRLKWGKENSAIILWWWGPSRSWVEEVVGVVELVVEVVVGVTAMAMGVGGKLVVLGVDRFLVGVDM